MYNIDARYVCVCARVDVNSWVRVSHQRVHRTLAKGWENRITDRVTTDVTTVTSTTSCEIFLVSNFRISLYRLPLSLLNLIKRFFDKA